MGESRVSPTIVGALAAVLVIACVAGYGVWRSRALSSSTALPIGVPVMVAVVLPDLQGVRQPRALAVYSITGDHVATQPVDPNATATIPGTSSNVLGGAYLYGGGDLLTQSYANLVGGRVPEWIVIDDVALANLNGNRSFEISIPAPIDVFDGTRLSSYPIGTVSVNPTALSTLMDGAQYLGATDRSAVRDQVSEAALIALKRSQSPLAAGVRTSMRPLQFEQWLEALSQDASSSARP